MLTQEMLVSQKSGRFGFEKYQRSENCTQIEETASDTKINRSTEIEFKVTQDLEMECHGLKPLPMT